MVGLFGHGGNTGIGLVEAGFCVLHHDVNGTFNGAPFALSRGNILGLEGGMRSGWLSPTRLPSAEKGPFSLFGGVDFLDHISKLFLRFLASSRFGLGGWFRLPGRDVERD